MAIFFAFIALILILKIFDRYLSKKQVVIILSTALLLIFALKDSSVGPDTEVYIEAYNNWPDKYKDTEPAYYILVNICRFLGLSANGFLMVIYVIFISSLGRFIYKYSQDVCMSYLATLSMGFIWNLIYILRQGLAACVIMLAIDCIVQKKPIKYVFLVLLAATFHVSALLCIPFYWLVKIRMNKLFVSIFVACSVIILIFKNRLIDLVFVLIPKYAAYLDYGTENLSVLVMIETIALLSICTFFYFRKNAKENKENGNHIFIKSIYGYAVIVLIATIRPVMLRMNLYFYPLVSILIPNAINNEMSKNMQKVYSFFAMIVLILRFYITARDKTYTFFWQ